MPNNELKNTLELRKILADATMIRVETMLAEDDQGKNFNILRARNKAGDYKEFNFEELGIDSVALKLYHNKTVTDMWAVGYDTSRHNNIGLTIEDGTLSCGIKKEGLKQLVINCTLG